MVIVEKVKLSKTLEINYVVCLNGRRDAKNTLQQCKNCRMRRIMVSLLTKSEGR